MISWRFNDFKTKYTPLLIFDGGKGNHKNYAIYLHYHHGEEN